MNEKLFDKLYTFFKENYNIVIYIEPCEFSFTDEYNYAIFDNGVEIPEVACKSKDDARQRSVIKALELANQKEEKK